MKVELTLSFISTNIRCVYFVSYSKVIWNSELPTSKHFCESQMYISFHSICIEWHKKTSILGSFPREIRFLSPPLIDPMVYVPTGFTLHPSCKNPGVFDALHFEQVVYCFVIGSLTLIFGSLTWRYNVTSRFSQEILTEFFANAISLSLPFWLLYSCFG